MRKLKMEELGRLDAESFQKVEKPPLVLVLDDIRSALNVGSLFRSADSFGVGKIILGGYTPGPPNRDLAKTALGAELTVAWERAEKLAHALSQLKSEGWTLLALEQTDASLPLPTFQPKTGQKYALILGNEVDGVSDEAVTLADLAVEIPQFGTKHSLNVAVAGGVALYALTEALRKIT